MGRVALDLAVLRYRRLHVAVRLAALPQPVR
jgi:hypothetical protein